MDDRGRVRFSLFLQLFAVVMFLGAGLFRGFALEFDALAWILVGAAAFSTVVAFLTFSHLRDS